MKKVTPSNSGIRKGMLLSCLCAVLMVSSCTKDDLISPVQFPGSDSKQATGAVAMQPVVANENVPKEALIYVSRGYCYGRCPVYTVMITHGNTAVYNGIANVAVLGKVEFDVPKDNVRQLVDMMVGNGFFGFQNTYPLLPDAAKYVTALQLDPERSKVVVDCGFQSPPLLEDMRIKIESTLRIDRFIKGAVPVTTAIPGSE